jgi:hypothetical protein
VSQLDDAVDHQRDQDGSEHSQTDQSGGLAVPRGRPGFGPLLPVLVVAVVVLAGRRFTWVVWRSVTRHGR